MNTGSKKSIRHNKKLATIPDQVRVLEKLVTFPGQGSLLEQLDKLVRKQQRIELYRMLESLKEKEIEKHPVTLDTIIPQTGKRIPALLRFSLPKWKGYDEVFWQALGDYIIVALHRVKDVEYDAARGKIKIEYFAKQEGRIRSPENIWDIIQRLAYMVDREILPADFTRFRRMTERRGSVGEMSKEQAALTGIALKLI